MPTRASLGPWLAAAVGLHLVADCAAGLASVPETFLFYGMIPAYAVPAALGLAATGRLTPWRAAAWGVLVVAAHGVAVFATFAVTAPSTKTALQSIASAGALGGAVGAALSLFGLIALIGARPSRRTLLLALGACVILSALGGGLCVLVMTWGLGVLQACAFAAALYLPWEIVFSLVVARLSSPQMAGG